MVSESGGWGDADVIMTERRGLPIAIATADCVPVVLMAENAVAIVHAGWRGARAGVIRAAIDAMNNAGHPTLRAAIGPAICKASFEVGPEAVTAPTRSTALVPHVVVDSKPGNALPTSGPTSKDALQIAGPIAAGQRVFGENRLQELEAKTPLLPTDIEWHLVGSIQSRKARRASLAASVLHGVDRTKLVSLLVAEGATVLVQVNIAGEDQKSGANPRDVEDLIAALTEAGVTVAGLMQIPPVAQEGEDSRRWFSALREMRDRLLPDWPTVRELSMGMTNDYGVAIEEGATIIRVGRAIFGDRPAHGQREKG